MGPEVLLWVAGIVGLYMAWNIGANDVANAMGTSVGSGALTLRGAVIVAAVFEFGGAVLVGGHVTDTVRKGIVDPMAFAGEPMQLALGMTCALLAAALWLNLATYYGWPVSTTHAIVGAVTGFGLVALGTSAIQGGTLVVILLSWVVSPVMGGLIAFFVFVLVRNRILDAQHPIKRLKRLGPWLVMPVLTILTLSLIYKGLKNLNLDLPLATALAIALSVGLASAAGARLWFNRMRPVPDDAEPRAKLAVVERAFVVLQIMTACFVAFAHGSNDVANAVGPMAAVVGIVNEGVVSTTVPVPIWLLLIGGVGIVVGLATYGRNVMQTIGTQITEITPSRGFAAEFGAAATILVGSKLGLPISTTHTLVGAVIGVGFARGINALDLNVIKRIAASWVVTVPAAAAMSAALYFLSSRALGI